MGVMALPFGRGKSWSAALELGLLLPPRRVLGTLRLRCHGTSTQSDTAGARGDTTKAWPQGCDGFLT